MALRDIGNTTVWIQAISANLGTKQVVDYHKEVLHMYAGQAEYLTVVLASDWIDVHSQKLAGATYFTFEIFSPTDLTNPWQSTYYSVFDRYISSTATPNGTYLFVARNYESYGGDADVLVQITKKVAVTKMLFPNARMALAFSLPNENEYFLVDANQTYDWLALDGGTTAGGSSSYALRNPSGTIVVSLNSYSLDIPVSGVIKGPSIGQYLLTVQGSGSGTIATIQITVNGLEEISLVAKSDLAISVGQTGQTVYYSINTTGKAFFVFSGSSERGVTIYRLFNFRTDLVWGEYQSSSSSDAKCVLQVPVGGKYLLSVQGRKSSTALIHIRFASEHDFSISCPDYSDFQLRFSGDFIMCQLSVPSAARYMYQYWNTLINAQTLGRIYDANYINVGQVSLYYQGSGQRFIWRKGVDSFTAGNWIVFITGQQCSYIRVSHLKDGDEEKVVSTPYQTFEAFDFDYQAKVFLVNVPVANWFLLAGALQASSTAYLNAYDQQLINKAGISIASSSQPYLQTWKTPATGGWLMAVDGLASANISLTFLSSADAMNNCLGGQQYTDSFAFSGECHCYHVNIIGMPFLGYDTLCLANTVYTYSYILDPNGNVLMTINSYTAYGTPGHYLTLAPFNGTWYLALIGYYRSTIAYRVTMAPDRTPSLPFMESISSGLDGKVTYLSVNAGVLATLTFNITSWIDADSWLYLHMPSGQLYNYYYEPYHWSSRNQNNAIQISNPPAGEWLLCFVQEVYGNLTVMGTVDNKHPRFLDFNVEFATNSVRVIYPSDNAAKPLGCDAAWVSDWTASAFVTTKLQRYTEGVDINSSFVDQSSGEPLGNAATGIVSFGGPIVNPVVKRAESDATYVGDRAPLRWHNEGGIYYFQLGNGSSVPGANLPVSIINNDQDMFLIEVYADGNGRFIMLCYGFGWKGTYAAGKYFHTTIYPNIGANTASWVIVKWQDSNKDGFVNCPGDGDAYTVIASG
jgi:hypothetical protein